MDTPFGLIAIGDSQSNFMVVTLPHSFFRPSPHALDFRKTLLSASLQASPPAQATALRGRHALPILGCIGKHVAWVGEDLVGL